MRYDQISEARTSNVARLRRLQGSAQSNLGRPALRDNAPRVRVQEASRAQSYSTRPKAEETRFPRPCRFASSLESFRFRFPLLPSQFLVGKALVNDLGKSRFETLVVADDFAVNSSPSVEPEGLLVNVPKQVERFNTYIGSTDTTFEQGPEILQTVGVNLAVNVLAQVIHNRVLKLVIHAPRVGELIRVNLRALPPQFR